LVIIERQVIISLNNDGCGKNFIQELKLYGRTSKKYTMN
jgi:hypothetical protein